MVGTGSVLWLPLGVGMIQRTSHLQLLVQDRLGDIYSSEHLRRSSRVPPVTFLPALPQLPNHKFPVFLLDSPLSNLFISLHLPLTAVPSSNSCLSSLTACSFPLSSPLCTLQLDLPFCKLICPPACTNPAKASSLLSGYSPSPLPGSQGS